MFESLCVRLTMLEDLPRRHLLCCKTVSCGKYRHLVDEIITQLRLFHYAARDPRYLPLMRGSRFPSHP